MQSRNFVGNIWTILIGTYYSIYIIYDLAISPPAAMFISIQCTINGTLLFPLI